MLSPESCAAVCPVAATFCGISGYACVVEKLQAAQEESSKVTVSNKELNDNGRLYIYILSQKEK